jgi:hypothetical protein
MNGDWCVRLARAGACAAVVLAMSVASAHAQDGVKVPVAHAQTISANPFGLMLEWFNAEYERKISESVTWGVSGSSLGLGDAAYRRGNVLFRYYPQGAALTGLFLGGRTGVSRVSFDGDSAIFYGAGFELGYSWLFGSRRNVGLSLGAGLDRIFGGDLQDVDLTLPNLRLVNIGIAF